MVQVIELPDNRKAVAGMEGALEEFERTLASRLPEPFASQHLVGQQFEPGNETAILRATLVSEEALEMCKALKNEDKEALLKEICDVLYVVIGTSVIYGFDLFEAFRRVHRNNMSKLINGTIREDGKLVKPVNHPKVSLEGCY